MQTGAISGFLSFGTAATWLLAACTTLEVPESEPAAAAVEIDLAIYSISGLITAEEALERKFRELLDAGIAAVSPDEVHAYLDGQEERLRGALAGTDLRVLRIGDYLSVRMPVQTIFSMGSADIDPAVFAALNSVSAILNEFEQSVVEIASHTDSRGSAVYNRELSSRRVRSLASFLQARNVDAVRVIEVPAGAAHPVSDDESAAGRELNRRVEVTLVPLQDREAEARSG
ncbi:MAG: cell envelope biogenesis protein OmpA [Gammaproteobacteria bacterium]|nr:MAG: cell envelope biogenesis protein OmpA [Gammaproteobacteria bacterium]